MAARPDRAPGVDARVAERSAQGEAKVVSMLFPALLAQAQNLAAPVIDNSQFLRAHGWQFVKIEIVNIEIALVYFSQLATNEECKKAASDHVSSALAGTNASNANVIKESV
jgi:hypothetical protein